MFYEYQCTKKKCLHITVCSRTVSERYAPAVCEKCSSEARKIFSIPSRAWGLKVENENYPMSNPWLSRRGEPPVVFESASERKKYYKANGLVDAVTPEAERQTMYSSDVDADNYKDFDKFKPTGQYVGVPDSWEDKPLGENDA